MSIALPANRLSQLQNSALDLLERVLNTAAAQVQAATDTPDPALLREARLAAESAIKLVAAIDPLTPPLAPAAPPIAAPESALPHLNTVDPGTHRREPNPPGMALAASAHGRCERLQSLVRVPIDSRPLGPTPMTMPLALPTTTTLTPTSRTPPIEFYHESPTRALLAAAGAPHAAHPP